MGIWPLNTAEGRAAAARYILQLTDDPALQADIKTLSKRRTNAQNAAYHGVWLKAIEEATGTPAKAWHEYFKLNFIVPAVYEIDGVLIECRETTTKLTTKEFSDFIDKIHQWCAERQIELPPLLHPYY